MNFPNPSCVFVMPVYNEEACIDLVVTDWLKVVKALPDAKFLLIDDGSKDRSGSIIDDLAKKENSLVVFHKPNGGHGSAILAGYRRALEMNPVWIFQVDSDDQIPSEDFWKLWDRRQDSSFILGRRADRHDPWHRKIASVGNRVILFFLFGLWTRDPNIPFRLMKADFLESLLNILSFEPFAPNIFLSLLGKKRGGSTLDIPVTHRIRTTGTPSLNFRKWIKACCRCMIETWHFHRLVAGK